MEIISYKKESILKTKHNRTAGFFSNCSVRLFSILNFFKEKNKIPDCIDSSEQFINYKLRPRDGEDLSKYFFEEKKIKGTFTKIDFGVIRHQYQKYKTLEFDKLNPFIETFFFPSIAIRSIVESLEKKYSIDYQNTCAVYYRGNDKEVETGLADYEEFFNKAEEILQKNPILKFLVQTDELEFAEAFKQRFPNSFWFDELAMINHNPDSSVHHSLPRNERKEHASYFFAAVLIMSKTKHLITYSGNCGLWAVLYRGHAENVYQYLKTINHKTKELIKDWGWI